jgi:hypothetical protein
LGFTSSSTQPPTFTCSFTYSTLPIHNFDDVDHPNLHQSSDGDRKQPRIWSWHDYLSINIKTYYKWYTHERTRDDTHTDTHNKHKVKTNCLVK